MVIEDVGNWFCNQTTGWLKIIKVNHDLVKKKCPKSNAAAVAVWSRTS